MPVPRRCWMLTSSSSCTSGSWCIVCRCGRFRGSSWASPASRTSCRERSTPWSPSPASPATHPPGGRCDKRMKSCWYRSPVTLPRSDTLLGRVHQMSCQVGGSWHDKLAVVGDCGASPLFICPAGGSSCPCVCWCEQVRGAGQHGGGRGPHGEGGGEAGSQRVTGARRPGGGGGEAGAQTHAGRLDQAPLRK
jgi:hypothetical protein